MQRIQYKPLDASCNEIRVLSFEPSSRLDDLSSRLDRILGLSLGPLRLTLENISLDDFKSGYTTFRTVCPTQWSRNEVDNAWCEQFEFGLGSASSEVFHTIARFTWGDYTAISYIWGSPEDTKTITINGMPVAVGKNLAAALDCLRSSLVDKVWIDALCIYFDRYRAEYLRNLRFGPLFFEWFRFVNWIHTAFYRLRVAFPILYIDPLSLF